MAATMVMTTLEARVDPARAPELQRAYAEVTPTPGLVESFLARDTGDPAVFRIVTIWADRAALDAMRSSGVKPKGVQLFEAVGASPTLTILDVVGHVGAAPR